MTGNAGKLALDLSFRWLAPVQLLVALAADYFYLTDRQLSGLMTGGVMLALQGTSSAKVALWRILPVTARQIGQARWWQMIGLPGLAIVAMMGAALVLHGIMTAYLPVRASAGGILLGLLLQFFYPVFLAAFSLAILLARTARSPFAYVLPVAAWTPWLLLLPHLVPLPEQTRLLLLGLIGAVTAVMLYLTAPHWPSPATQSLAPEISSDASPAAPSLAGRGGWFALCGMALLQVALVLVPIMALYIAAILALNLRQIVPMQMQLFIPFIVISQISRFNGAGLRLLRALPGSAHWLTSYLFLLPLALLATVTIAYSLLLAPWLSGAAPRLDMLALTAVLFAGALTLPAALSLSQAAMSLVMVASMMLVAVIEFGWAYLPAPWQDQRLLGGVAIAVMFLGFFWMHARISRGTRVYRLQPFMPARWRGKD